MKKQVARCPNFHCARRVVVDPPFPRELVCEFCRKPFSPSHVEFEPKTFLLDEHDRFRLSYQGGATQQFVLNVDESPACGSLRIERLTKGDLRLIADFAEMADQPSQTSPYAREQFGYARPDGEEIIVLDEHDRLQMWQHATIAKPLFGLRLADKHGYVRLTIESIRPEMLLDLFPQIIRCLGESSLGVMRSWRSSKAVPMTTNDRG